MNVDGDVVLEGGDCPPERSAVFTFQASDSWQGLEQWSEELALALDEVRRGTGAPEVTLVGFSAGGIAARQYLVDHPTDHGVAQLVTVGSPHGGSELALAAKIAPVIDDLPGPLQGVGQDLVDWLEGVLEIRLASPLVTQLMPPEEDNYLDRLNRAPHPTDVEYSCVISSGTPGAFSPQRLRQSLARFRGGGLVMHVPVLERALTWTMRALAIGTENDSAAGDGAVLLASQNLGRVEFFRDHPGLLREIELIEAGHLTSKQHYGAIASAISGRPQLRRSKVRRHEGKRYLRFRVRDFLPTLSQYAVVDPEGRELPIRRMVGVAWEGRGVVDIEAGPLGAGEEGDFELRIQPVGDVLRWQARLSSDGSVQPPPKRRKDGSPLSRYHVSVLKAWGFGGNDWDAVGKPPDVEAILYVDGREILRSRRFENARGLIRPGLLGEVSLARHRSQVRLELWDLDFGRLEVPEMMAAVDWLPNRLPLGRSIVALDHGLMLQVEVLPADSTAATVWMGREEFDGAGS